MSYKAEPSSKELFGHGSDILTSDNFFETVWKKVQFYLEFYAEFKYRQVE